MRAPAPPQADSNQEEAPVPSNFSRSALHLLRFAVLVDPGTFFVTIFVSVAGSLAEGFGLVLLLPLLAAAGMNFAAPSAAGRLATVSQRLLLETHIPHSLWLPTVLGVFLLTGAVRSILRRSQSMLSYTTTTAVQLTLSRRVYEAIVKAQWGYLVRQRSGTLTHLLTEELRQVSDAITLSLSLINLMALTLLYLAFALKLSLEMTLLVLALGAGLMLLQRASLGHMRSSGRALSESVSEVYAATEEHLLNLKSVKTYDAEDRDVQLFADLCNDVVANSIRTAKQQAAGTFRFETGSLLALGAVIFLALAVLHVQAATMLLLLAIFSRLMPQLSALQSQLHQFAGILPSFEHVLRIEAACAAHAEPPAFAAIPRLALTQTLRLEDISFSYRPESETHPQILDHLNLTLAVGSLTALVGPSGAGKSTLADILNGLLMPTQGRILLDDHPLTPAELRQWRRQVGYVGQETVLFHQSIRANLLWADPAATERDLRDALTLAAATFVYDLPAGLDTLAGDRGILLSSGQRQRIALARALLRKPTLLLLDEATNALDIDNEARILDALQEVLRLSRETAGLPLTILMIAHRASAIGRADHVITLESGRVTNTTSGE